jgi:hypothetical protein
VITALALVITTVGNFSQAEAQSTNGLVELDGRVYVLRGDLGIFFSTGMDYLVATLNQRGLTAGVYNWWDWSALANDAIARYAAAPERTRILLVGHSRGGDGAIAMAWRLHSARVPVALAVAFDSTRSVDPVPPNVERFINLYQSTNAVGGGAARLSRDFRGDYVSVNLAERREMNHVNIDKMLVLHHAIVPKFVEAVSPESPPGLVGIPSIPIEYRVPAGVPIEVWDSGMQVRAAPGDTTSSVAQQFSVPTWVIAQLNQLAGDEPVEPGRTLLVPRMIFTPPNPTSSLRRNVSLAPGPILIRR